MAGGGDFYAQRPLSAMGVDLDKGVLRLSFVHYTDRSEVDALIAALDSGQIGHATLDVFRTEPLPPDHPIWAHPKVTVTPTVMVSPTTVMTTRTTMASPMISTPTTITMGFQIRTRVSSSRPDLTTMTT